MAKVVDGKLTEYVYDTRYRVLEERDESEALLALYTYGTGMDEPLTMERDGETYTYHRDALGSVTEVSDESGAIVERYEYDVYGEATIYDGSGVTLTASAIGNPYLFTGRRYDPESGNYYYRARTYSPRLGRFLSQDPLGFDAGDYNLYRYAFNNPTNLTDPTGEFAFVPWLLKASTEAAVDALMQATFNYFFNPSVTTVEEALASIELRRVGWAFVTGLLPVGGMAGRVIRSLAGAAGDVIFYVLDAQKRCQEPDREEMLRIFALSLGAEVIGDLIGDAVAEHGTRAVAKGLRKLGFDELAEKILRQVDEAADDAIDGICFEAGTPVATAEGSMPIERVGVGDRVWGVDPATGTAGLFAVTEVFSHHVDALLEVMIGDETIRVTEEHPFWVAGQGWVAAEDLEPGDCVRALEGTCRAVEQVTLVSADTWVYNITVAEAHTYLVGSASYLVHNRCSAGGRWIRVKESMSPAAAAYQTKITGRSADWVFELGGVRFDGISGSTLLEAKGPGYSKFISGGQFQPWFEGQSQLLDQARRQIDAAQGQSIIWHVAESDAAQAIRNLLQGKGYSSIRVVHTP